MESMAYRESTLARLAGLQPAQFEKLASRVLRAQSGYEALSATGMNTRGRTIPAPMDAFCWLPGTDPPQAVLFAYTTTERRTLRAKWLQVPSESPHRKSWTPEGDVLKALREAQSIRQQVPDSVVTLVLACVEDPAVDLMTSVKALCRKAAVEVDFWPGSRLVDFLDEDPRGQRLRQEFFDIPQKLLSTKLLSELSQESCRRYSGYSFEDQQHPRIDRTLDRRLWEEVLRSRTAVRFLVSDPGFGKTFAALGLLRRHLAAGAYGLWLLPEDVMAGVTPQGSIEAALRRLQPQLQPGCGRDALNLAAGKGSFLLILDDLNQSSTPTGLIHHLLSWIGVLDDNITNKLSHHVERDCFILCPIWPSFLAQLPEALKSRAETHSLHAGPFTPEEGMQLLLKRGQSSGVALTKLEAGQLSESLGHDPLLLNLLSLGTTEPCRDSGHSRGTLHVIQRFLEDQYDRLAERQSTHFTASQFEDSLLVLADLMLTEHQLAPTSRLIHSWFHSRSQNPEPLTEIAKDRRIAHFVRDHGEEVLHFRHDRVRDTLFVTALTRKITNDNLEQEILAEPFYAHILAQALMMPDVDIAWFTRCRCSNPLALFLAFQLIRGSHRSLEEVLAQHLKAWLTEEVAAGQVVDAITWEAAYVLANTDSPRVLDVSRHFPQDWLVLEAARFRNGDLSAALNYCNRMGPGLPYSGFVSLLEHVTAKFGATFRQTLSEVLCSKSTSRNRLRGALVLAGHIADPTLFAGIQSAWMGSTNQRVPLLGEFLWAVLRCLPDTEEKETNLLELVCRTWRKLPDKPSSKHSPPQNTELVLELREALLRRGVGSHAVSALISKAKGRLEWPLALLLSHVDAPEAVEFTVQRAAAGKGGWREYDVWSRSDIHGQRLGRASVKRLEELWKSVDLEPRIRSVAFQFWSLVVDTPGVDELENLRSVGSTEPFYPTALHCRIRCGDRTAADELIQMVETDTYPHFWWQHAHLIWNHTLRAAFDSFLGRLSEDALHGGWDWEGHHFCAAELLVEIPEVDAEVLLTRHWEHFKHRPVFVRAALAIATPRCCELVAEAVTGCPQPRRLLQYFEYISGIWTQGRGQKFGPRQLQAIIPYLELFSPNTIDRLWWWCNENRQITYRKDFLDVRLTSEQKAQRGLGREALFLLLDQHLRDQWATHVMDMEIELSQQRGESWKEFFEILLAWLGERRSLGALEMVARAIISGGSRGDLEKLCQSDIDGDPLSVQKLLERTAFQVFRRRLR